MLATKPAFLARVRREAVETGVDVRRATEGPADVVDTTSSIPTERTPVRACHWTVAVADW